MPGHVGLPNSGDLFIKASNRGGKQSFCFSEKQNESSEGSRNCPPEWIPSGISKDESIPSLSQILEAAHLPQGYSHLTDFGFHEHIPKSDVLEEGWDFPRPV